jgi:RNA polymerase sigma factor (sigma-70 family)
VVTDSSSDFGALLQRIADGDPEAREVLIERCQEQLRKRVSQMLSRFPAVRRSEATSDVLQEVLLDLSHVLSRVPLKDVRHFLGVAGQRIRWKLLDLARLHERPVSRGKMPDVGGMSDEPGRLAQWAEIHAYIQELPDDERELFDLLYYQGVPKVLVAEMLGIPLSTLKRRWRDARLRFMERFGDVPA